MELFGIQKKSSKEKAQAPGESQEGEEQGAAPQEAKTSVVVVNDAFWIALMRAASAGDVETVRRLAEEGVEVNGQSPNGTTPLIAAVKNGQATAAFELLELGADLSITDAEGLDAVAWAQKAGHALIVEELKQRGSSALTPDEDAPTPQPHTDSN
jgi:ankyrin repeat protein